MLASSVAAVISLKEKKSCSNCSSFHNIYRFFYQSQYSLDRASLYKWPWAPLSSYWLLRVEKRGLWEKMLPGGEILFSSVQSLSRLRLFATPWIAARQTSLSITNSPSLLKLMSIVLVMPSSHLILCCPLLPFSPSFPASGSFPMSQLFAWGGQRIGVSASTSVLPVKEESEKVDLKLNIQKTKIMASGPITSWQIDGETVETVSDFILGGLQNHCRWWLQSWN